MYHTKGCSRSSVDSREREHWFLQHFEPFSSHEFRASTARTLFSAMLWRSSSFCGKRWPEKSSKNHSRIPQNLTANVPDTFLQTDLPGQNLEQKKVPKLVEERGLGPNGANKAKQAPVGASLLLDLLFAPPKIVRVVGRPLTRLLPPASPCSSKQPHTSNPTPPAPPLSQHPATHSRRQCWEWGGVYTHEMGGYHLSFWRFFPCFTVFFASKLAIFPLKRSVLGA